jgi:hypothetical protein
LELVVHRLALEFLRDVDVHQLLRTAASVTVDDAQEESGGRGTEMGVQRGAYAGVVAGQWVMSDAWVFASIEGVGPDDGSTLAQVVAKADLINHAILTEAEFIQAVGRLVAAGLIGAEADRYWLTEAGRALYRQGMKRRGLFGWIDGIPPALRRLGEPQDNAWSLPPGVFDRAIEEYSREAHALANRHQRQRRGES